MILTRKIRVKYAYFENMLRIILGNYATLATPVGKLVSTSALLENVLFYINSHGSRTPVQDYCIPCDLVVILFEFLLQVKVASKLIACRYSRMLAFSRFFVLPINLQSNKLATVNYSKVLYTSITHYQRIRLE